MVSLLLWDHLRNARLFNLLNTRLVLGAGTVELGLPFNRIAATALLPPFRLPYRGRDDVCFTCSEPRFLTSPHDCWRYKSSFLVNDDRARRCCDRSAACTAATQAYNVPLLPTDWLIKLPSLTATSVKPRFHSQRTPQDNAYFLWWIPQQNLLNSDGSTHLLAHSNLRARRQLLLLTARRRVHHHSEQKANLCGWERPPKEDRNESTSPTERWRLQIVSHEGIERTLPLGSHHQDV